MLRLKAMKRINGKSFVVMPKDTEKATLSSMREVENAANMFYYTEE